jgi:hypothetical protein
MTDSKVRIIINRKDVDPEQKARVLARLEEEKLTFDRGVETAEAGIAFTEWPYRCPRAKEFRAGYFSAVTIVDRDDLIMTEDGAIINEPIN